ncbi:hemolymph lipopolysaccharide-binding protein-like isoform X1 [Ischnura elegans]|uniref:hemolymph lipopolysaccharide-binding protein-like isoform X1 n=1 Tax=Ischnura elegans TaxID=197161 RepID=UPI001ED87D64|nr:hemolymph lipopolysaccharide-binding protein-like isoform X1 [Ischnura elegans]
MVLPNDFKVMFFWIILLSQKLASSQPSCLGLGDFSKGNKTLELSIMGHRNQSGHWTTQFLLNEESQRSHQNWKLDLKHTNNQYGGVNSFHIKGAVIVPPPRPLDYEHIPGIGFYKFHYGSKLTFQEAHSTCTNEGGHLAILNSQEEATALKALYKRHSEAGGPWSYIGIYDQNKARDFVTIYGQPLKETGFPKWHPGQPEDVKRGEFCGCFVRDSGLLADVGCGEKLSFFCEYDLSWNNL